MYLAFMLTLLNGMLDIFSIELDAVAARPEFRIPLHYVTCHDVFDLTIYFYSFYSSEHTHISPNTSPAVQQQ